jgi:hypothetical protein
MTAVANLYLDPGFESGAIKADPRVVAEGVVDDSRVVGSGLAESDPSYGPTILGERSLALKTLAAGGPLSRAALLYAPPASAASAVVVPNLGTVPLPAGVFVNGGGLVAPGLVPGSAVATLGGTNYIDTGWKTRTNLCVNPLKKWNNFFTQNFGTTVLEEKEGWTNYVTATSKASIAGNTQFLPVASSEACRFPVVAGEKIVIKMPAEIVQAAAGMQFTYGLRYLTAAGSFLSSDLVAITKSGTQTRVCVIPGGEVAFAQPYVIISSTSSGTVVTGKYAWKEPLWERGEVAGEYFPTVAQLESGLAGWSGTANESASDIGPFARGVRRTFLAAFNFPSITTAEGICGGAGGLNSGVYVSAAGNLTFRLGNGETASNKAATGEQVKSGASCIVAVAWDGVANTYASYVNAVLVASGASVTTHQDTGQSFIVGNMGGNFAAGQMLPFAVFLTDLSEEEVAEATAMLAGAYFPGRRIATERRLPAKAGQVFSAGALSAYASPDTHGELSVGFRDEDGEPLGEDLSVAAGTGELQPSWLELAGATAPPGTAYVAIGLSLWGDEVEAVGQVTFDEVALVEGALAPEGPIDGDRGSNEWTGPRFTSSAQQPEAPQLALQEGWAPSYLWEPPFYQESEEP